MRTKASTGLFCAVAASLLLSGSSLAQNPQLQLKRARRFPTVVFNSVQWNGDPSYYSVAIDSTGTATYQSAPVGVDKTGVPFTTEFHASDRTTRIIFNLARRLDKFAGSYGETRSNPDKGSVRTLFYLDDATNSQFTYSDSTSADSEELTSIFEELSETFEYGRKVIDESEHNRAALPGTLEEMQARVQRHSLRDFQALTPVLRTLVDDPHINSRVQAQAQSLIKVAESNATGQPPQFAGR